MTNKAVLTCMFLLLTAAIPCSGGEDIVEGPLQVSLQVLPRYFLHSPVRIKMLIENIEGEDTLMTFAADGKLEGLELTVLSPDGKPLERRILTKSGASGPPIPVAPKEQARIKSREKVAVSCDLDWWFIFSVAGKHQVSWKWGAGKTFESSIEIVQVKVEQSVKVSGYCNLAHNDPLPRLRLAECDLRIGTVGKDDKKERILQVVPISGEEDSGIRGTVVTIPLEVKAVRADLDFKGWLWVELAQGQKHNVLVCDLRSGQSALLASWETKAVKITACPVRWGSSGKVVMGGVEGQTLLSSHCTWQELLTARGEKGAENQAK